MSYATSIALQKALFQLLSNDPAITGYVGAAIFDAVPEGPVDGAHIVIGDEDVRDWSNQTGHGAEHRFVLSVVTDQSGFAEAKEIAAAVSDAVVDATPVLERGRIVSMRFSRARARRVRAGQTRRIDMTFRALVEDE